MRIKSNGGGIIRIWTGTDALTMVKYPPGEKRWYVRIFFRRLMHKYFDFFFKQHWVCAFNLAQELIDFGIDPKKITTVEDEPLNLPGIQRAKPTKSILIAYYKYPKQKNKKFKDWVYGLDIIEEAMKHEYSKKVIFYPLNGKQNMRYIYPVIDLFLRPNRHDAIPPRTVRECRQVGIPIYWDPNFTPSARGVVQWIEDQLRQL